MFSEPLTIRAADSICLKLNSCLTDGIRLTSLIGRRNFMKAQQIIHPFAPCFDEKSKILILGSLPSVKSREQNFYYGHPQNRFWKVLAGCLNQPVPQTIQQKKEFILSNHMALWDIIASCTIEGSSDSSIKDVIPQDLSVVLEHSRITLIICNGKTSEKYFKKYAAARTTIPMICLPSTSPANAAYSLDKLISLWKPVVQSILDSSK